MEEDGKVKGCKGFVRTIPGHIKPPTRPPFKNATDGYRQRFCRWFQLAAGHDSHQNLGLEDDYNKAMR